MALTTRQRQPYLPSDLPPSSPTYTKFDKKLGARSDGGDAPEDDREEDDDDDDDVRYVVFPNLMVFDECNGE
ncbi:hypothetical protein QYF36_015476 [Acer negundo]|nr:hypothetical protein QYF36_015476 [Acer negundo]